MNPTFDALNFRVGRRQMAFECGKPVLGNAGVVTFRGLVEFAEGLDTACRVARGQEREFRGMVGSGEILPVKHAEFPEYDGFYTLVDIDLDTAAAYFDQIRAQYVHRLGLTLKRIGSANDVKFISNITGAPKTNNFGVGAAFDQYTLTPPPHGDRIVPRVATTAVREVEGYGNLTTYRGIALDDNGRSQSTWSTTPDDWYIGAASIQRRTPLYPELGPVHGRDVFFENVEDVRLDNGIVRFWIEPGVC